MTMAAALRLILLLAGLGLGSSAALAAGNGDDAAKPEAAEDASAEAAAGEAAGEAPLSPLWPETPAVETARQPYVLIRSLRALQDEIASGSVTAHRAQRPRMEEIREQLRDLPVAVWDDVRNVRAVIYFVLSGGDPSILKIVIGQQKSIPLVERRLLKGALAYGEGRMVDALSQLHKIDARSIDALLSGIVALIQATLIAKKDPIKALSYFDEARLFAPGTLVEEAALRQQILILARDGQLERFDLLSGQYTRRFPNSIFARNFRRQFFAGVARQSFKGAEDWISRTETELEKMPVSERPSLYLAIADEALKVGNLHIARFAAEKARVLSAPGSRTLERAKVFEGAALAVSEEFAQGLELLSGVDIAKITVTDRQIRESAMAVATNVGKWPAEGPEPADLPPLESIGRAEAMLAQVDSLLGGSSQ